MDKKSFQEQLENAATSLGFSVEVQQKIIPQKKGKEKPRQKKNKESSDNPVTAKIDHTIKKLSLKSSRKYVGPPPDVIGFANKWASERETGKISVSEEFFNLADLALTFSKYCRTWQFKRSICLAAARTDLALELAPTILKKSEVLSFKHKLSELKYFITEIDFMSARKELFKECEREYRELQSEHTRRLWEPISVLSDRIFNANINSRFPQPILDEQDIKLAIIWSDKKIPEIESQQTLFAEYGNDWFIARSLSARSAEKAAMKFYLMHGFEVEDISIHQVTKNGSLAWVNYDLTAGGNPVDVKNSRRSQHSPNNYTEHCVPRFKLDRKDEPVKICGVFSPYLRVNEMLYFTTKHSNLLILGETSLSDQIVLKSEFEEEGLLQIDLHKKAEDPKYFLPPWLFNYPKWAYGNIEIRPEEKEVVIPSATICSHASVNPVPLCLIAGIDLRKFWHENDFLPWQWEFFQDLSSRFKRCGRSLPILFLSILKHFLLMVTSAPQSEGYNPIKYRRFIFYNNRLRMPSESTIH